MKIKNKTGKIVAKYIIGSGLGILIFYITVMIKGYAEFEIKTLPFISLILVCTGYYIHELVIEGPRFLVKFEKDSFEYLSLIPLLEKEFQKAGINGGIKVVTENDKEVKRIAVAESQFKEALEILINSRKEIKERKI